MCGVCMRVGCGGEEGEIFRVGGREGFIVLYFVVVVVVV